MINRKAGILLAAALFFALPHAWAAPDGGMAQPGLLDFDRAKTSSGIPVAWIAAEDAPWATVQLHVSLHGIRLSAQDEGALTELALRLAQGNRRGSKGKGAADRVAGLGGKTSLLMHLDGFAISDGVPADKLDAAIKAMRERLSARMRLAPTPTGGTTVALDFRDASVAPESRELLAPGHAYARSQTWPNRPPRAAAPPPPDGDVDALANALLVRGAVAVVVVGGEAKATKRSLMRHFAIPLPKKDRLVDQVASLTGSLRVAEQQVPQKSATSIQWYFPGPGWGEVKSADLEADSRLPWFKPSADAGVATAQTNQSVDGLRALAARAVLAELVKGAVVERAALSMLTFTSTSAATQDGSKAGAGSIPLSALRARAEKPGSSLEVSKARERVKAMRLEGLSSSVDLAFHLGIGMLFAEDPRLFEAQIHLLDTIGPADIQAAARAALSGPRVLLRNFPPPPKAP
jgi:hypothetical protein